MNRIFLLVILFLVLVIMLLLLLLMMKTRDIVICCHPSLVVVVLIIIVTVVTWIFSHHSCRGDQMGVGFLLCCTFLLCLDSCWKMKWFLPFKYVVPFVSGHVYMYENKRNTGCVSVPYSVWCLLVALVYNFGKRLSPIGAISVVKRVVGTIDICHVQVCASCLTIPMELSWR